MSERRKRITPRGLCAYSHSGEELKDSVVAHLKGKGLDVVDTGSDKYYVAAANVAKMVQSDREGTRGMVRHRTVL